MEDQGRHELDGCDGKDRAAVIKIGGIGIVRLGAPTSWTAKQEPCAPLFAPLLE
jgi:hypothetical protein